MIRPVPDMFDSFESSPPGELAQLVERCDRTAEVRGSNPLFSIAMMAWPLLLASLPLLQTAQDRIVLLHIGPLQPLPAWALPSFLTNRPPKDRARPTPARYPKGTQC